MTSRPITQIEARILAYVAGRCDMLGTLLTRADIPGEIADVGATHAVNALWDMRLIESSPLRRAHAPHRFQITQAGRDVLAGSVAA
jgi:hypothetical protein